MSPCSSTQIDHLSIACCMKGKCMHAVQREKRRRRVKEWERSYNPNHFFPFFFHTFFLSPMSFPLSLSLPSYTPPFLSLPLHRGIQSLRWDWSSLKVIQNCTARCLCSPPSPPPSTLGGPGSSSTESRRAPNPGPGLALLPQASLIVPLQHRKVGGLRGEEQGGK